MSAMRLLRVERTVSSLDSMVPFYCKALGFEPTGGAKNGFIDLRLGEQIIRLTELDLPGAAYPAGSSSADLWFQHLAIVTPDMQAAYARLHRYQEVPVSQDGPQLLPPATGSVTAYKFRDPDHHPLELIHFPPGTGDARWQQKTSAPTIGIDHSALSVSNAGQSIAFYCGILGMQVAARQTNRGAEQERLDNLTGDVVEVVALEFTDAKTPHIELLAYQNPVGRKLPKPLQPQDIAADRLVFEVTSLAETLSQLNKNIIITQSDTRATIRDPDGHLLILEELTQP